MVVVRTDGGGYCQQVQIVFSNSDTTRSHDYFNFAHVSTSNTMTVTVLVTVRVRVGPGDRASSRCTKAALRSWARLLALSVFCQRLAGW